MKRAADQPWHNSEWFADWLALMRHQQPMKTNPKHDEIETPAPPEPNDPMWPGDFPPIQPGTYPNPKRDETTVVPLVR